MTILEKFNFYMRVERGMSPTTQKVYKNVMQRFEKFIRKPLNKTTRDDFDRYIDFLYKRNLKSGTIHQNVVALKSFFNFVIGKGIMKASPINPLFRIKVYTTPPDLLTPEDVKKIRKITTDYVNGDKKGIHKRVSSQYFLSDPHHRTLRDKAFMEVLIATGMRISELMHLRVEDVDLKRGRVQIRDGSKYHSYRPAFFNGKATTILRKYLKILNQKKGLLFHIKAHRAHEQIKKYVELAGIKKNISSRSFRRYFATYLFQKAIMKNKMHESTLQRLMGHKSIQTTHIYITFCEDDLEREYRRVKI